MSDTAGPLDVGGDFAGFPPKPQAQGPSWLTRNVVQPTRDAFTLLERPQSSFVNQAAQKLRQGAAAHSLNRWWETSARPAVQTAGALMGQSWRPPSLPVPWHASALGSLQDYLHNSPAAFAALAAGPFRGVTQAAGAVGGLPLVGGIYRGLTGRGGFDDLRTLLGGAQAKRSAAGDLLDDHLGRTCVLPDG